MEVLVGIVMGATAVNVFGRRIQAGNCRFIPLELLGMYLFVVDL